MNPHAAGFDDPKLACDRACRCEREKIAKASVKARQRARPAQVEDNDAGAALGRKARDLAEVAIQCDQRTPFRDAGLEHDAVGFPAKPLFAHADRVMATLL